MDVAASGRRGGEARDGRSSLAGFDSKELMAEGQIAILPEGHLSPRTGISLADVNNIACSDRLLTRHDLAIR
ncbi:hypothetical protein [Streptomyces sp. NPDC059489]|uniref:hypothetical protein n=1 Tax=Streptomyces sp. NPDC059489 TaxID=3346849 RepID=UPI0036B93178